VASAQASQDFLWPPATHRPGRAHHQQLGTWWCPPAIPPPGRAHHQQLRAWSCPRATLPPGRAHHQRLRAWSCPRAAPSPGRAHHQRLRAWWCHPATPPPGQGPPPTAASVVVPSRDTPSLAGPTTNSCERGRAPSCPTVLRKGRSLLSLGSGTRRADDATETRRPRTPPRGGLPRDRLASCARRGSF